MTRKRLVWVAASVGCVAVIAVVVVCQPWKAPVPGTNESDPPAGPHFSADGDPLPPGAITRIGTGRFRTGGQVWLAAVTPDGRSLVISDRIMDAATGRVVGHIPNEVDGQAVGLGVVSAGGETAALCGGPRGVSDPQTVVLWDVVTRKPTRTVVRFVQFSPDGKRLVAADGDGTVWVWDATAR
jgi:WD40 repeat protein